MLGAWCEVRSAFSGESTCVRRSIMVLQPRRCSSWHAASGCPSYAIFPAQTHSIEFPCNACMCPRTANANGVMLRLLHTFSGGAGLYRVHDTVGRAPKHSSPVCNRGTGPKCRDPAKRHCGEKPRTPPPPPCHHTTVMTNTITTTTTTAAANTATITTTSTIPTPPLILNRGQPSTSFHAQPRASTCSHSTTRAHDARVCTCMPVLHFCWSIQLAFVIYMRADGGLVG